MGIRRPNGSSCASLGSLAAGSTALCRTCYFDTLLFKEQEQLEGAGGGGGEVEMPDYAPCPCCVLAVYGEAYAQDEDGQRCKPPSSLFFGCCCFSCNPKAHRRWAESSRRVHR